MKTFGSREGNIYLLDELSVIVIVTVNLCNFVYFKLDNKLYPELYIHGCYTWVGCLGFNFTQLSMPHLVPLQEFYSISLPVFCDKHHWQLWEKKLKLLKDEKQNMKCVIAVAAKNIQAFVLCLELALDTSSHRVCILVRQPTCEDDNPCDRSAQCYMRGSRPMCRCAESGYRLIRGFRCEG